MMGLLMRIMMIMMTTTAHINNIMTDKMSTCSIYYQQHDIHLQVFLLKNKIKLFVEVEKMDSDCFFFCWWLWLMVHLPWRRYLYLCFSFFQYYYFYFGLTRFDWRARVFFFLFWNEKQEKSLIFKVNKKTKKVFVMMIFFNWKLKTWKSGNLKMW